MNREQLFAAEAAAKEAFSLAQRALAASGYAEEESRAYYAAKDELLKIRRRLQSGRGWAEIAAAKKHAELSLDDA